MSDQSGSPEDGAPASPADQPSNARLIAIELDQASIGRGSANIDHEREVAIYELLDANTFEPEGRCDGPYKLNLSIADDRLVLAVGNETEAVLFRHVLSLTSLRKVIKDYFIVCDSYYGAIRTAPPSKIQAIDMGRRALHDEGSRLLTERLKGKVTVDHDTARRLFTLICALHWKG